VPRPTRVSRGPTRRQFVAWLAAAALPVAAADGAGAEIRVEVTRVGDRFEVRARAAPRADLGTAWATLVDYERLPRFIPGIESSRVLARRGDGAHERLLVEQVGSVQVLFFVRTIHVWLDVTHERPHRVDAYAVVPSGVRPADADLRTFHGRYELQQRNGTLQLDYRAEIEPAFAILPLLGTWAARRTIERQFRALVSEIERRANAAASLGG
jgi:hypothetical protein